MMQDLAFDVVELAPCPGSGGAPWPVEIPQLREVAYRWDGWSSEEVDRLHAGFVADAGLGALTLEIGRPLHGVRSKIQELGWRRNSRRPWCELEDAYLAQHYGTDAASTIAGALGRSAGAVSARASLLGLTEEQRFRWVSLIAGAADEAGLPTDPEFRSAFMAYVEWGTRLALANSQPGAEPPLEAPVPRWGWGEAPPYLG